MSHSSALIQLVSEQTMPNVIAALAARPERIVLIHTQRTTNQVSWIRTALTTAGLAPEWDVQELSESPDIRETGRIVTQAIERARENSLKPVINFTGGTKLMSIGAFAACARAQCPSFYVDTEHSLLHDGSTGALPETLGLACRNLVSAISPLSLDVLSAAHGVTISAGRNPALWLPLVHLLARDRDLERISHDWVQSIRLGGNQPKDFLHLVETPLHSIPDGLVEPLHSAGAIELRDGNWHFVCDAKPKLQAWAGGQAFERLEDFFAVADSLSQVLNLLEGGWWELAVLEAARESGRFQELRWSVERSAAGRGHPIEEDILASDGLQLALFSCKRGGERSRLLRAFDELDSAGRQLGGIFCSRFLCVALPIAGYFLDEVRARAQRSRTSLIGPVSRLQPTLFRKE